MKTKVLDSKTLHKKAWNVFSQYIREIRDCDICYTCGNKNGPNNAGHFWHACLDFDEENIHCQCVRCNKWLSGNLAQYSANLIRDMGPERFRELEKRHYLAMRGEKRSIQDYLDIIEKYKKKIAENQKIKYN